MVRLPAKETRCVSAPTAFGLFVTLVLVHASVLPFVSTACYKTLV
jgi:hypothetical protein